MTVLIGTREAARVLGLSRSTVNRRAGAGNLPYVEKLPGRLGNYVFDRAEIERIAMETTNENA